MLCMYAYYTLSGVPPPNITVRPTDLERSGSTDSSEYVADLATTSLTFNFAIWIDT